MLTPRAAGRGRSALAEVRDGFVAPKIGTVAGCYGHRGLGQAQRTVPPAARQRRDLRRANSTRCSRFKDDVREVKAGFECGIELKNYNDVARATRSRCSKRSRSRARCKRAQAAMRKDSSRVYRIGALLKRELAGLIRQELSDPRAAKATITDVDVAPDLSHAKIFVTHLDGVEHARPLVKALNHASGFLRHRLADRVDLRVVPTCGSSTTNPWSGA